MVFTFCVILERDKKNLIISISAGKKQDFYKFYKKELIGGLEFKSRLVAKLLNSFAIGKKETIFSLKNETSFHEIEESTDVLSFYGFVKKHLTKKGLKLWGSEILGTQIF